MPDDNWVEQGRSRPAMRPRGTLSAGARRTVRRAGLLAIGMLSMACGVWLGLVRIGWPLPLPWPDQLIAHGPLMVCGFLGTLISLERAVALGARWSYAAPVLVAGGALLVDFGSGGRTGPLLMSIGSLVLVAIAMNRLVSGSSTEVL